MFKGHLKSDAPAVFSSLRRLGLSETGIYKIEQNYATVWASGALDEKSHSRRTPGANFNPRPARLMAIAIKELHLMLSLPLLEELLIGLSAAPNFQTATSNSTSNLSRAIINIDELRHLHLLPQRDKIANSLDQTILTGLPERLALVWQTAHRNALALQETSY